MNKLSPSLPDCEIESLDTTTLQDFAADMWWLSPPCQPYSRRGHQRDIDDPRARSLLHIIQQIERVRPHTLALENVEGFANSRAFVALNEALCKCAYHVIDAGPVMSHRTGCCRTVVQDSISSPAKSRCVLGHLCHRAIVQWRISSPARPLMSNNVSSIELSGNLMNAEWTGSIRWTGRV